MPGGMSATLTMHGVCSYVYSVKSRRPGAASAGQLALKVMLNMQGDQTYPSPRQSLTAHCWEPWKAYHTKGIIPELPWCSCLHLNN